MSIEPTARAGTRFGGHMEAYPKPWRLQYGEAWSEPRPITIKSHVWRRDGLSLGANGHHHADIDEEDNRIWGTDEEEGRTYWGQPWRWKENREMRATLRGRSAMNTDLIRKRDVVKWAVEVLREWGVLGNKNYAITWDLDEDDPLATQDLADVMRKRTMSGD